MFNKNHISFNASSDIREICQPIFQIFKFNHFTFCRVFPDGSRAILTTTPDSLYDLYVNKRYLFRIRDKNTGFDLHELHSGSRIQYYFQAERVNNLPDKFQAIRQIYLEQIQYEKEWQGIQDRFIISIKYEKYHEFLIFFIPISIFNKNICINNLEIFHHFRAYFLDKAQKLILQSEKDKLLPPIIINKNIQAIHPSFLATEKPTNQMQLKRYYILDSNTYLTKKQFICATYMIHSYSAKQIARITGLSNRTVEAHIECIKIKFNCKERSELIKKLLSAFPEAILINFHFD